MEGNYTILIEKKQQQLTNKIQAVFQLYDEIKIGEINSSQLRYAINSAGYRLDNHILNMLAHRYATKKGVIPFDDFLMCVIRLKSMIGNVIQ